MADDEEKLKSFGIDVDDDEVTPKKNSGFELLPEGFYTVEIGQVRPKANDRGPMFGVQFIVTGEGGFEGRSVWTNVIFLPSKDSEGEPVKGAGFCRQFLKAVELPYKGKIKVDPTEWSGKVLGIYVIQKGKWNNVTAYFNEEDYVAAKKEADGEAKPEPEKEAVSEPGGMF